MRAQQLWFAILEAQIETGNPYMLFKDTANRKSNQQVRVGGGRRVWSGVLVRTGGWGDQDGGGHSLSWGSAGTRCEFEHVHVQPVSFLEGLC